MRSEGENDRGHDASGPYREGKYSSYEGGTRVPLVFSWPGKISPGVSNALVGQMDFLASFASLLDIEIPEGEAKDSRNLLSTFMGESEEGVDYLLQGFKTLGGLRYKHWKYIPARKNKNQPEQLYNLDLDAAEQNNLIGQYPEVTQHMRDMLAKILEAEAMNVFD